MAQLVKTVQGLAIASVKTVQGLAIASVKTVQGVDNTSGGTPTVSVVGATQQNVSITSTTIATPTTIDVVAGDLIVFSFGASAVAGVACTAASSPSVGTFTEIFDVVDTTNNYVTTIYALVATSSQTGVTFTGTFSATRTFRYCVAGVYRLSSGTFSIGQCTGATATPGQRAATSSSRTATNLTTAQANSLLVAIGVDWDGTTHTAANGYTLDVDGTTPFLYHLQVSSIGTYPSGNYGTVSPADEYFAYFLEGIITP